MPHRTERAKPQGNNDLGMLKELKEASEAYKASYKEVTWAWNRHASWVNIYRTGCPWNLHGPASNFVLRERKTYCFSNSW